MVLLMLNPYLIHNYDILLIGHKMIVFDDEYIAIDYILQVRLVLRDLDLYFHPVNKTNKQKINDFLKRENVQVQLHSILQMFLTSTEKTNSLNRSGTFSKCQFIAIQANKLSLLFRNSIYKDVCIKLIMISFRLVSWFTQYICIYHLLK